MQIRGYADTFFTRTIPELFSFFQGLNFFPILKKNNAKNALYSASRQSGNRKNQKGIVVFFGSDSGDKNLDYCTN